MSPIHCCLTRKPDSLNSDSHSPIRMFHKGCQLAKESLAEHWQLLLVTNNECRSKIVVSFRPRPHIVSVVTQRMQIVTSPLGDWSNGQDWTRFCPTLHGHPTLQEAQHQAMSRTYRSYECFKLIML